MTKLNEHLSGKTLCCWALTIATLLCCLPVRAAEELHLASNEKALEQTIASRLLRDIYQTAGLTIKVEPLPAARANALNLRGEKDGEVARIRPYADKHPTLLLVEPAYYYLATGVFTKAGSSVEIKDKTGLAKYRVGVVRGIAHAEAAVSGLTNVETVDSYEQLYRMVDAGRIDVAIDTSINGQRVIRQLGLDRVLLSGEIGRYELYNILNPRHKALVPRIAAAIKAMKTSGELSKLTARYENEALVEK